MRRGTLPIARLHCVELLTLQLSTGIRQTQRHRFQHAPNRAVLPKMDVRPLDLYRNPSRIHPLYHIPLRLPMPTSQRRLEHHGHWSSRQISSLHSRSRYQLSAERHTHYPGFLLARPYLSWYYGKSSYCGAPRSELYTIRRGCLDLLCCGNETSLSSAEERPDMYV